MVRPLPPHGSSQFHLRDLPGRAGRGSNSELEMHLRPQPPAVAEWAGHVSTQTTRRDVQFGPKPATRTGSPVRPHPSPSKAMSRPSRPTVSSWLSFRRELAELKELTRALARQEM